jgi:hypothetical protein
MSNGETDCEKIKRNMDRGDDDMAMPSPNGRGSRAATNTSEVRVARGRQSRNSIAMERTRLLDGSVGPRYIGESTIRHDVPCAASPLSTVVTICTTCHWKTPHFAHAVYLCVPYDSRSKQRVFHQAILTAWFL